MKKILLNILIIFASAVTALTAQDVKLSTNVDKKNYRIGEWIDIKVDAEYTASVENPLPLIKDSLGSLEIIKIESEKPKISEKVRQSWLFRVTSWEPGEIFIPSIQFAYRLKGDTAARIAKTNPFVVTIDSVAIDSKAEIRDIKPPLSAPWKFEDFLPYIIGLAIIALICAGYWYYKRWKKKKELEALPELPRKPDYEEALDALKDLEEKNLWQQSKIKLYYSEVTEIIRRYFERRFEILALEMTSDEILSQLKNVSEVQPMREKLSQFFLIADLTKFAKHTPSIEDHKNEMLWALEFVRSTIPAQIISTEAIPAREVVNDVR